MHLIKKTNEIKSEMADYYWKHMKHITVGLLSSKMKRSCLKSFNYCKNISSLTEGNKKNKKNIKKKF